MKPEKLYNIVFYADRAYYGWERASYVTISDAESFKNQSSDGRDTSGQLIYEGEGDPSTKLPANNWRGYVARFNNISAGSDSEVVLTISSAVADANTGKYASALMVEELSPVIMLKIVSPIIDVNLNNIILKWSMSTDVNKSGFEVERASSKNWAKIGYVQSSDDKNSQSEYSFTDKELNSGKYIYRLKMINSDGTFSYSDIVEAEVELPKEYAISQNYPNPFNPTTKIDYQLPFDSKVTIKLYGITGEKVATLTNNELAAGFYTAELNANMFNLASGVYICRMVAQDLSKLNEKAFMQIRKLMLLK
jgi:hypothetical protein